MTEAQPLWIARVAGDQETMGRQHGALAVSADVVERLFGFYPRLPELMLVGEGGAPGRRLARGALGAFKELALAHLERKRPAELRARSRAFLEAAGRSPSESRYLGVFDLFQNVIGLASRYGAGPFARKARQIQLAAAPACSTVMAWGGATEDGEVRHARNFDFPGIGVWDVAPAVVLCAPDRGQRYGFVTTRGADVAVVTVFNEAGLVITSHSRFHHQVDLGGATIADVIHEIARRAETLADAVAIAKERSSASSWGLGVSSTRERRAISIELHAGACRVVDAAGEFLVVTNRYRHPDMHDGEVTANAAWALHSDQRERRLRALCERPGAKTSAEYMAMLADREDRDAPGVRRHLGGIVGSGCTVHSVVVEPATRSLLLGVGLTPACDGPFVRVTWDWDGPVGAWDAAELTENARVRVEPVAIPGLAQTEAAMLTAAVVREEQTTKDPHAIAGLLERAIAAAPEDPSLRLGATWTHLRRGDAGRALAHARAGLVRETLPYRRGQLLLWGARAALSARDDEAAATMWTELDRLAGGGDGGVAELQASSRRDRAKPGQWRGPRARKPDATLFLMDAH